jgi:cytochrome c oxidase subunit 1
MTAAPSPDVIPSPADEPSYLAAAHGIWSWLNTRDHKRIALMFYVTVLGTFLLGGVFALALRTELLTPRRTVMDAETYNRMFTLHGVTMV